MTVPQGHLADRARAGWVACLVAGVVVAGAVPIYAGWSPFTSYRSEASTNGTHFLVPHPVSAFIARIGFGNYSLITYWLIMVPVLYLALAFAFRWRANRNGVAFRWWIFLAWSAVSFIVADVVQSDPRSRTEYGTIPHVVMTGVFTPIFLISVSLVALGAVERDRRMQIVGLVVSALAFGAGVLGPYNPVLSDSVPAEPLISALLSPQGLLAVEALVLLLAGLWLRRSHP